MKKLFLVSFFASSFMTLGAAEFQLVKGHTDITFMVKHMLISTTRGVFKDFKGDFSLNDSKRELSNLSVEIQADSIFTNDTDRDNHLKNSDFFNVEKYPVITFKLDKMTYLENKPLKSTGVLNIRSVEKRIPIIVTFNGFKKSPFDSKIYGGFTVKGSLDRKDFGMIFNKTLDHGGLAIDNKVMIEISGEFVQK
jgi:polyisoprenoid-binding protein YceI